MLLSKLKLWSLRVQAGLSSSGSSSAGWDGSLAREAGLDSTQWPTRTCLAVSWMMQWLSVKRQQASSGRKGMSSSSLSASKADSAGIGCRQSWASTTPKRDSRHLRKRAKTWRTTGQRVRALGSARVWSVNCSSKMNSTTSFFISSLERSGKGWLRTAVSERRGSQSSDFTCQSSGSLMQLPYTVPSSMQAQASRLPVAPATQDFTSCPATRRTTLFSGAVAAAKTGGSCRLPEKELRETDSISMQCSSRRLRRSSERFPLIIIQYCIPSITGGLPALHFLLSKRRLVLGSRAIQFSESNILRMLNGRAGLCYYIIQRTMSAQQGQGRGHSRGEKNRFTIKVRLSSRENQENREEPEAERATDDDVTQFIAYMVDRSHRLREMAERRGIHNAPAFHQKHLHGSVCLKTVLKQIIDKMMGDRRLGKGLKGMNKSNLQEIENAVWSIVDREACLYLSELDYHRQRDTLTAHLYSRKQELLQQIQELTAPACVPQDDFMLTASQQQ